MSLIDTVSLYVSPGLRQIFRRVDVRSDHEGENGWLYIPPEQMVSIRQSLLVSSNDPSHNYVAKNPIAGDEYKLYPILVRGHVLAVLVDRGGKRLNLGSKISSLLLDSLLSYDRNMRETGDDIAGTFVATLFQHDCGYDRFIKRLLELLTEQSDGGIGGAYYNVGRGYGLRIAVGGLDTYDRLPAQLDAVTARQWLDSVERGEHFIRAELLPEQPTLLSHAPPFLFVHPGVRSERTECLIAVTVRGDIEFPAIVSLSRIAGLASQLRESQFGAPADLTSLYGSLASVERGSQSFDDMLVDVFRLLERQAHVSRLVFAGSARDAKVVSARPGASPQVVTGITDLIDESVFDRLERGDAFVVSQEPEVEPAEASAAGYDVETVKSEICFPIRLGDRLCGVVAIGSTVESDYLVSIGDFLAEVCGYVRCFCGVSRGCPHITRGADACGNVESGVAARERLATVSKLADGYFHATSGLMSVILGQAEVIEREATRADISPLPGRIERGLWQISQAAGKITAYLENLRQICALGKDRFSRNVSCHGFLRRLPSLVEGYSRHIKDSKNVSLEIHVHTACCPDFSLSYAEIYDCVIPVLLALMEEAICSGVVSMGMENYRGCDSVTVEFDQSIIGHTTVGDLVRNAFRYRAAARDRGGKDRIDLGTVAVTYGSKDETCCRVIMSRQTKPSGEVVSSPGSACDSVGG